MTHIIMEMTILVLIIMQIVMIGSAREILELCTAHSSEFDLVNYVTAFHRLARMPT